MTPFDRQVRAQVFRLIVGGVSVVDATTVAESRGWEPEEVRSSLNRLADLHRLALIPGSDRVAMAHPFSGVETPQRSVIGDRQWYANCAWDALAILSLLGDGSAHLDDSGLVWTVEGGRVSPGGVVHLLVPARRWWEDVGFT